MRHLLIILAIVLSWAILGGCAGKYGGALTPSAVINMCYALDTEAAGSGEAMGGSTCDFSSQDAICSDFGVVVSQNYGSMDDCMDECELVRSRHWLHHSFDGCSRVIIYGETLCKRYCRQQL